MTSLHLRRTVLTLAALAVVIALANSPAPSQPTLTPGRAHGDVVFSNTSAAVRTYLGTQPVVPSQAWEVRLTRPGEVSAAATTGYTAANTSPDVSSYVAATYEIHPHVEASGSDFILS